MLTGYSDPGWMEMLDQPWQNNEEALEVLNRFCIILNYYFQGDQAHLDMPEKW